MYSIFKPVLFAISTKRVKSPTNCRPVVDAFIRVPLKYSLEHRLNDVFVKGFEIRKWDVLPGRLYS